MEITLISQIFIVQIACMMIRYSKGVDRLKNNMMGILSMNKDFPVNTCSYVTRFEGKNHYLFLYQPGEFSFLRGIPMGERINGHQKRKTPNQIYKVKDTINFKQILL